MKFFQLFFTLLFLIHSATANSASGDTDNARNANVKKTRTANNGKSTDKNVVNKTTSTRSKKAKKQIVRTMQIREKKNNAIRASKDQMAPSNAYNISERTINIKSPMCQYVAKNDVISLKKALLASNYSISEVNTICKHNESLLLIAVKNNNFLTAKFLIEKGANVNFQNEAGVSALHIASRIDTSDMDRIFDLLINTRNLNVDIKDMEGYTPLMRAVEFEKLSVIQSLVKIGADLDVKNNYGFNVMELAKRSLEGKRTKEEIAVSQNIIDILSKKK